MGKEDDYKYETLLGMDPLGIAPSNWWAFPENLQRAKQIGKEEEAKRRAGHNNSEDAMRHAEWSRRMALETTPLTALIAGLAHEVGNIIYDKQPASELLMDLYNNKVGRIAASEGRPVDPDELQNSSATGSPYSPYRGASRP